MCVKLLKDEQWIEYDCDKPLVDQIVKCSEILVNYKPKDQEVEKFLTEMQKSAKNGLDLDVKIKVEYNDFLDGYKTKKQLIGAINDITVNQIIKLLVLTQRSIDKSLEELSVTCSNR